MKQRLNFLVTLENCNVGETLRRRCEQKALSPLGGLRLRISVLRHCDRWSLFEAYEELRQFGYLQANIVALWYKDPSFDYFETSLKMLKGDAEAIEMCNIAGLRGLVELYVVHDVGDAEPFPEVGYVDVGGVAEKGTDDGLGLVVFEGHGAEAAGASAEPNKATKGGDVGDEFQVDGSESNDEDSEDPEYMPSDEDGDSVGEVYFADSDEDFEGHSGFDDGNSVPKEATACKEKGKCINKFSDEDGADSDELEMDHMIGGDEGDEDEAENVGDDISDRVGQRFPVHKPLKDMSSYRWEVGTRYASRQEFKEIVLAYAVHTARSIKFKKCDLVRVIAVCQKDCPFWLYAHKVESNPRIKIRELQAKAHKKWNVTVTKSMAAKSKQEALSQIQGAFREQCRRINDYCAEILRANPVASSTSKKPSHSQPIQRKRPFSVIQTGAPHIPMQKLKLMAKLPPSAWGNL
ncbi:hypothetical protein Ahy_A04g021444 [Arachis hypogaea]|uniref:Uncharacterized protein n=1 Tax=Arachis hypogaea TaxID=3818 RepID=A0A445DKB4_ARAHY|nr:hypothetical protein Ahy_A04g021444 [Arachis hypogaea]